MGVSSYDKIAQAVIKSAEFRAYEANVLKRYESCRFHRPMFEVERSDPVLFNVRTQLHIDNPVSHPTRGDDELRLWRRPTSSPEEVDWSGEIVNEYFFDTGEMMRIVGDLYLMKKIPTYNCRLSPKPPETYTVRNRHGRSVEKTRYRSKEPHAISNKVPEILQNHLKDKFSEARIAMIARVSNMARDYYASQRYRTDLQDFLDRHTANKLLDVLVGYKNLVQVEEIFKLALDLFHCKTLIEE